MENLNAENIKRGLERCAKEWHCGLCGFTEKECALIKNSALALINSQEQRIKELAEENERLQDLVKEVQEYNEAWVKDNHDLRAENERLRAENETLKIATNDLNSVICNCHDKLAEMLRQKEADTVRNVQERLKGRFSTASRYTKYSGAGVVIVIDSIANEMLEGEK